ncbi:MAG: elongation factor G [Deltaproteobacteria bacterium]|jgi:elongation factor G|nr:elongation factor G [Deltaproteobacteria bacterium]
MPLARLRNIGIIAHIDAGKTTLSERMLFYTEKIHRMGEVHDGNATMDYLPEEQERGITINSACTSCVWQGHAVNLIDTPGHVDFTIEVERSLRVLDGAVGVFCAVAGVEPQSETVWRQSEHFAVPKLAFINKMDRSGADFAAVVEELRTRLGATPAPLHIPLGEGENFKGIIDVIAMESLHFDAASQGSMIFRAPLAPEQAQEARAVRERSLETLAEADEVFLEAYLGGAYTEEDIHAALRRACIARLVTPVLCGSALRNCGVQPVLDAVCRYLPSPLDRPAAQGQAEDGSSMPIAPDPAMPLSALVFKVLMEHGRKLALLRLYAGTLREGDACRNLSRRTDDRAHRMYRLHADRREQLAEAYAGDIVAVVGLRSAQTGDTYGSRERPLLLEPIAVYQPVITLALEPRNADEGKVLDEALERFVAEDPTLTVHVEEASGHRYVSGMGELHLDVLQERIRREYGIAPRAGNPQVVLRETIRKTASAQAEFDRELGKERHYGNVSVRVRPRTRGSGNHIFFGAFLREPSRVWPKVWSKSLLDATRQGVADALQSGALTAYPVQDVEVEIAGLVGREGVSSPPGHHMAAGQALRDALAAASPVALEPVMAVEISVPEQYLGPALSLFGGCGGKIEDLFERAGQKIMRGLAPMRQLFGFATFLRSATQGRAGLVMKFEKFDVL